MNELAKRYAIATIAIIFLTLELKSVFIAPNPPVVNLIITIGVYSIMAEAVWAIWNRYTR